MRKLILNLGFALGISLANVALADWFCEISCRGCGLRGTYSQSGSSRSGAIANATYECKLALAELLCSESHSNISVNNCIERVPPAINGTPKQYNLTFRNLCLDHDKIWTAVHRQNLDGKWEIGGYWGLNYGEIARVGSTKNRTFFIHGHTDANITWGKGAGPWKVRGKTLPFSKITIPEGTPYGDYQFKFTCN